jgi:hypothetical protein
VLGHQPNVTGGVPAGVPLTEKSDAS